MLKKMIDRVGSMCDAAYFILKLSLVVSCPIMAGAAAAYAVSGGPTVAGCISYSISRQLFSLPAAILFAGVFSSVIVEDLVSRG
ncbi:MAG: hypothetical protein J5827_00630 [Oscillospiraceae bacterium]|nr:hypothetical protein [Oscillospiraceae bacterium]